MPLRARRSRIIILLCCVGLFNVILCQMFSPRVSGVVGCKSTRTGSCNFSTDQYF